MIRNDASCRSGMFLICHFCSYMNSDEVYTRPCFSGEGYQQVRRVPTRLGEANGYEHTG